MGLNRFWLVVTALLVMQTASMAESEIGNTISRNVFNFGHQLGYIYSRMDDAYFDEAGAFNFETGLLAYYTSSMPRVQSDEWKERLICIIPLYFEYFPTNFVMLKLELTDLFIEYPYKDIKNTGGKSPRFEAKIRLVNERKYVPSVAFTIGVKFSSAKPYTIWRNEHNYYESNGLAGAGTGVADYFLIFTLSKKLTESDIISARFGLAPLGSPVEYERGSAQADQLPYGVSYKKLWDKWEGIVQVSGMYNGLRATELAHYSVFRFQARYHFDRSTLTLNFEKGLTRESDEWVLGVYQKFRIASFKH